MHKTIILCCFLVLCILSFSCYAVDPDATTTKRVLDFKKIEKAEEKMPLDDVNLFDEEYITKELDGTIDIVGDDYIVVSNGGEKRLKLIVDAETVIYVEDEKADLKDISEGDSVFAFYIDEGGILKCDLLDVVTD